MVGQIIDFQDESLRAVVLGRTWQYSSYVRPHRNYEIILAPNGNIQTTFEIVEHRWNISGGKLHFYDCSGAIYATLTPFLLDEEIVFEDSVNLGGDGPVVRIAPVPVSDNTKPSSIHPCWRLEVAQTRCSIGAYSHGLPEIIEGEVGYLTVGKYCTLGKHGRIAFDQGPRDDISVCAIRPPRNGRDHVQEHLSNDVVIGNDVWLGTGFVIRGGITIGDGAIIGMNAVVIDDVPAYTVVDGAPAKFIKKRFDEDIVQRLLGLKWWDWPQERVARMLPLILSEGVETFLDANEPF